MPSNHLILCRPLLLLPSIFPSIRVFSNESVLTIRWPKYWSFSFSISPSSEYSGLMDWLDLLAVQGTIKSLLQHHSSKASILWHSAFFVVQLSHPYMSTGKTIALTTWTFVGKVMALLLNILHDPSVFSYPEVTVLVGGKHHSTLSVHDTPSKIYTILEVVVVVVFVLLLLFIFTKHEVRPIHPSLNAIYPNSGFFVRECIFILVCYRIIAM